MRRVTKRVAILAMALALLVQSLALPVVGAAPGQNSNKLSKHDRELLADAVANGKSTVTVLIASQPGANNTVASGLASLGATVRNRDEDVSYIRAVVAVDKV